MVFTLVIWVFSFLSLLLAVLFFVFFLSHYIPRGEGGLSGYCERKATKRLMQIVSHKINKAMAEEEKKRRKAELKAAKKMGGDRPVSMKATLPDVGGEKLMEMPTLNRNDTMTTLPQYSSRPGTPGSIELSNMDRKRPLPSRTGTMASGVSNAPSYSSRQGLLGAAAQPGYSRAESPAPSLPPIDLNNFPPARSGTMISNSSLGPARSLNRAPSDGPDFGGNFTSSPATYSSGTMPSLPPSAKVPLGGPGDYRGQTPVPMSQQGQNYRRPTYDSEYSSARGSPAPYPMDRRPTQDSGRQPYDDYSIARGAPAPHPLDGRQTPNTRPAYGDNFSARASPAPYPADAPYPHDERQMPNPPRPGYDDQGSIRGSPAPYPPGNRQPQNIRRPTFDQYPAGRASPGPMSSQGTGPGGYPVRSATNPMPRPLGPQLPGPSRVMTAPLEQQSISGSLRNAPSNGSRPFHQSSFSNSSHPNREPTLPQISDPSTDNGDYDYHNRPPTSSSQRSRPSGATAYGNGNGNGWNLDVERGQGSRY